MLRRVASRRRVGKKSDVVREAVWKRMNAGLQFGELENYEAYCSAGLGQGFEPAGHN